MPPYLAGRATEEREFRELLDQTIILKNLLLTGLRGVGKTVLLETLKPLAIEANWAWVGTDLSESASITEAALATRIVADLAIVSSAITISDVEQVQIGFSKSMRKRPALRLTRSRQCLN